MNIQILPRGRSAIELLPALRDISRNFTRHGVHPPAFMVNYPSAYFLFKPKAPEHQ